MQHDAVNAVITRLVEDDAFAVRVHAAPHEELDGSGLTSAQRQAVAAAIAEDARRPGAEHDALRRLACFEPLFASYSASSTKKG